MGVPYTANRVTVYFQWEYIPYTYSRGKLTSKTDKNPYDFNGPN